MWQWCRNHPYVMWGTGLAMGLLVGVGMLIGALAAVHSQGAGTLRVPETLLHASASHSGETMALATGHIDSEVEGLFILDYLTGELQCFVLNPRSYQFAGMFKRNVIADLGVQQGKKPSYVLVTGAAEMRRGAVLVGMPAMCVAYVADSNTGNVAAYSLLWNPNMAKTGAAQVGELKLLATGKARTVEVRDQ